MSDRAEYLALKRLESNPDYQILMAKWAFKVAEIQKSRDNAASRGQESAWRYFAGQEKGAQTIIMSLPLAIKDLEDKDEDLIAENKYGDLLNEIRGERKI